MFLCFVHFCLFCWNKKKPQSPALSKISLYCIKMFLYWNYSLKNSLKYIKKYVNSLLTLRVWMLVKWFSSSCIVLVTRDYNREVTHNVLTGPLSCNKDDRLTFIWILWNFKLSTANLSMFESVLFKIQADHSCCPSWGTFYSPFSSLQGMSVWYSKDIFWVKNHF